MGKRVWEKWGLLKGAEKGMWEEALGAARREWADEGEVEWEVERGGEGWEKKRLWRRGARLRG